MIGTIKLPLNFKFNQSLHYLIPEVCKNKVSLDEYDHFSIRGAIKQVEAPQFLHLIDKYKNPATLENFIIMIILNIRDNLAEAVKTVKHLLNSLGK